MKYNITIPFLQVKIRVMDPSKEEIPCKSTDGHIEKAYIAKFTIVGYQPIMKMFIK